MIKVSTAAADHIKKIAAESGAENLALRLAARVEEDGSFEYAMGFDEAKDDDQRIECEGITLVVAPNCSELLDEASLDFVEVEEGKQEFIFYNPNDPNHKQPKS